MGITYIIKLIEDFGTNTLLIAMFLYFGFKLGNYYVSKLVYKVRKPIDHHFFSKIRRKRKLLIPNIKLNYKGKYSKGRTQIFKDMLIVKFKLWEEGIKNIIYSKGDLDTIRQQALIDIYKSYCQAWEDKGIPKIVINKFNNWHGNHIKLYQRTIENISNGDCFSSRDEKINAILEISISMIILTLSDAELSLGDINGELSGLNYKGIIVE